MYKQIIINKIEDKLFAEQTNVLAISVNISSLRIFHVLKLAYKVCLIPYSGTLNKFTHSGTCCVHMVGNSLINVHT